MIIEVQLDGPEDLQRHLEAMAREYPHIAADAAWKEMSRIMNATKPKVPVDKGFLRTSGVVQQPIISDGEIDVEMGFYMKYAGYVEAGQPHRKSGEEARHTVGQSHFAEQSWNELEPSLLEAISKRIDAMVMEVG